MHNIVIVLLCFWQVLSGGTTARTVSRPLVQILCQVAFYSDNVNNNSELKSRHTRMLTDDTLIMQNNAGDGLPRPTDDRK